MSRRLLNFGRWSAKGKAELQRGIGIVIAVALLNAAFDEAGLYRGFEQLEIDKSLRLFSSSTSRDIAVVVIDDYDYHFPKTFNATSPLNPDAVKEIIKAILQLKPKAIAVDLDRREPMGFENLDENPDKVPIVQAVGPELLRAPTMTSTLHLSPEEVLALPAQCGVPLFFAENDGVVRTQRKRFLVEPAVTKREVLPSLPFSLISSTGESKSCTRAGNKAEVVAEKDSYIRFTGGNHIFECYRASAVVKYSSQAFGRDSYCQNTRRPDDSKGIEGKIVILGGTFKEARDSYTTPLGQLSGVEILAHATQTLIDGDETWKASPTVAFVLDVLLGILAVGFVILLQRPWNAIVSLALPVLLAILANYLLLTFSSTFASMAGTFAGIPLSLFIEHWLELRKLRVENEKLKLELQGTRFTKTASEASTVRSGNIPEGGGPQ